MGLDDAIGSQSFRRGIEYTDCIKNEFLQNFIWGTSNEVLVTAKYPFIAISLNRSSSTC